MPNPDDEDNEDLGERQRRIALDNARKSGASIDVKGRPLRQSAEEYVKRWPSYCRTCNGIGGHRSDPARMPKECPDCYGRGVCGRCAAGMAEHEAVCPSCGWEVFKTDGALPGSNFV